MPSADVQALTGIGDQYRWNIAAPVGTSVVVTYSFSTVPAIYDNTPRPSFQGLSVTQQDYARQALSSWGDISGISFVEVPAAVGGQIRFGLYDMTGVLNSVGAQASGFSYYPQYQAWFINGVTTYSPYFDGIGGDIFLNANYYAGNDFSMSPGQRGYSILLHEIGHALGFKHPFEGTPTIDPAHDSGTYTVMSYTWNTYPTSLGTVDVDAIRYYYGTQDLATTWNAATSTLTRTGTAASEWVLGTELADVLSGLGGSDTLRGEPGNDTLNGGAGADTLDGGAGTDTAGYFGVAAGVVANLTNPSGNTADAAGDTYISIENLDGSNFDDVLTGDNGPNTLTGDGGNDVLDGGLGTNILDGGAGTDTVSYASATAGVSVRLDTPTVNPAFGLHSADSLFDTLISVENVTGSDFADNITGKAGEVNVLSGGGGDDTITGEGIDIIDGGSGNDVFFGGQGAALNINLATSSIETVWGSFVGDVMDGSASSTNLTIIGQGLTGGANADTMQGGSGNDFVYYRAGDIITGGAGNDWAVATLSTSGVNLNMTTTGFENAWGSTSDDTITAAGSSSAAVMVGDTGNDTLTGGNVGDFLYGFAGADTLNGGAGNDNLIGGADTDTFAFGAGWGTDIAWDWVNGAEQFNMQGSGAADFAALTVDQNFAGSGNAYITFGSNHILAVGGANQIDPGDFIF